jgi:hypothetical protein
MKTIAAAGLGLHSLWQLVRGGGVCCYRLLHRALTRLAIPRLAALVGPCFQAFLIAQLLGDGGLSAGAGTSRAGRNSPTG